MNKLIDISLTLSESLPSWPGSAGFRMSWSKTMQQGDVCNNSQLTSDSHIGTHIDAPLHFVQSGASVETIPLEILVGPCHVIHFPNVEMITADLLQESAIPPGIERLLLKTDNTTFWTDSTDVFMEDFVALAPDAAQWIVDRQIKLVGIDYLSIGSFKDGVPTHEILLNAGIVVVEGLLLTHVKPGPYELICLPLKIKGAEGAPARAVLKQ